MKWCCVVLLSLVGCGLALAEPSAPGLREWLNAAVAEAEVRLQAAPTDLGALEQAAYLYHFSGAEGDVAHLSRALVLLEQWRQLVPNDPVATAWLGSATAIQARDAPLTQKLDFVRRGLALLDAAVAAAPNDPEVRVIRATNNGRLPGILGRSQIARDDFAWLEGQLRTRPEAFTPDIRRAVLYHSGAYYLRQRDRRALALLREAATAPGAPDLEINLRHALAEAERRWPSR